MSQQPLRIIFAGTPDFSVAPLQTLIDSEHEVIAVYTQPDRPAGRGRKLTASPVKQLAETHQIQVFQPEKLKDADEQAALIALKADLMIVVAYGLILPQAILEAPKFGCFNIHASLLPRWRGAAPIQRAIESGDSETGVTIMQMDMGLDTGDMLHKLITPIQMDDSAQTLHDRLSEMGCTAMMETLQQLQTQTLCPEQQSETQVTYAEKMHKAEAEIDWQLSAQHIQRKVQAFNPWPVAFTHLEGSPIRIWQSELYDVNNPGKPGEIMAVEKSGVIVQTGNQALRITKLQPSGKKAMPAYDFAQSRNLVGKVLHCIEDEHA